MQTLNILCIADTHGSFLYCDSGPLYDALNHSVLYDGIFCLGDITVRELMKIKMLAECPIYIITGNHDDKNISKQIGIPDIHAHVIKLKDYSILGWSGSVRYKNKSSAIMMTDAESVLFAQTLSHADILLSHDSVKNMNTNISHSGLAGISSYIEEQHPLIHIHGHMHQQTQEYIGQTLSIGVFPCTQIQVDQNGILVKNFNY